MAIDIHKMLVWPPGAAQLYLVLWGWSLEDAKKTIPMVKK